MARFQVKYLATELVQVHEQSDCNTVEQFINCRFGTCDVSGVEVTLVSEDPAPVEVADKHPTPEPVVTEEAPKPASKPKAAKWSKS